MTEQTPTPAVAELRAAAVPFRVATLDLTLVADEHQRRQEAGLGAILHHGLLETLLALPAGEPVPYSLLTAGQRRDVERAPAGVLDRRDGHVTRLAVRPCRVDLAVVRGNCSATALGKASSFAPFCARAVLIRRRPRLPETLIEFDFWGVGVIHEDRDGTREVLVEPTPWRPMRHTAAGWYFAEEAYRAALAVARAIGGTA